MFRMKSPIDRHARAEEADDANIGAKFLTQQRGFCRQDFRQSLAYIAEADQRQLIFHIHSSNPRPVRQGLGY